MQKQVHLHTKFRFRRFFPKISRNLFEWYSKAAEHGDLIAINYVGSAYYSGDGVAQDQKKAFEWFSKAAEQGHAGAQAFVGLSYMEGVGIPKNRIKAYEWLLKSASQGDENAQDILDRLCRESPWACK